MAERPQAAHWIEALHRAVVGETPLGDAQGQCTREAVDPAEFAQVFHCLRLLEQVRREHDGASTSSAAETPRRLADASADAARAPQDVRRIGRFQILRELGGGGHGIVFLARDPALGRLVALKTPRPDVLAVPEMRKRFLREAQAAARLSHRNLVAIYEVSDDGPVCFLAAEYCPGPNLAMWLAEQRGQTPGRPTPPRLAAELVAQLADGVSHAHAAGVLHRDIKPSNVLLMPAVDLEAAAGSNGASRASGRPFAATLPFVPKLTDFGLARVTDAASDATRTGAVVGTPAYMAPEQIEGRTREIAEPTDVYALGAVLYEALTGQAPFVGATTADILRRTLMHDPAPIDQLRAGVSRELQAVCLKCLEKEPSRRYAMASDLAADLRRYLHDEPTLAQPLGRWRRSQKWVKRRPLAAALMAVLSLSAATVLGISGFYNVRLNAALKTSEERRQAVVHSEQNTLASRAETQRLLYAADMSLADEAYRRGRPREAENRLRRYLPTEGEEDLRDFAWRYLWARCHDRQRTLRGHAGPVYWATYSHDGKLIASASQDGTARIWNAESAQLVRTLAGHESEVNCVCFSPDDRLLASAGDDGSVRIWSVSTGAPIKELERAGRELFCVQFSPDGLWLAAGGKDRQIRVWRTGDWSLAASLVRHQGDIESLCFSPDGKRLASGGADQFIRLWSMDSLSLIAESQINRGHVGALAYSPDGAQLASGSQSGHVRLHDPQDLRDLRTFEAHSDYSHCSSLAFSADGRRLLTAGRDGTARLWGLHSNKLLTTYYGHSDRLWHVDFSHDGTKFLTCSSDNTIKICKFSEPVDWLPQHYIDRGHIGFTAKGDLWGVSRLGPDAQGLALYHGQHVDFWRPPSGSGPTIEATLVAPRASVALAVDVAARWLRWTADQRWRYLPPSPQPTVVHCLAISPNGQLLAEAADQLVVRSIDGWREVFPPQELHSMPSWCEFSADSRMLAVGLRNGEVRWWNIAHGNEVAHWSGGFHATSGAGMFSSSSGQLALACEDGHARILDVASGKLLHDLPAHRGVIWAIAFSEDGRNVATAGADRSVYVWNLRTERNVLELSGGGQVIQQLKFSPSGDQLIGVSPDDNVLRWTAPTEEQPANVSHRLVSAVSRTGAITPSPLLQSWPTLPIGEPPRREDMHPVLFQWSIYSGRHDAVCRPTFDDREDDHGLLLGTLLLSRAAADHVRFSTVVDLENATALSRDADQYAQMDHAAGFPTCQNDRVMSLGVLPANTFVRDNVPAAELVDIDTPARLCREIHRWAKRHGYAGGFPTFAEETIDGQQHFVAILLNPEFCEEQFIPASVIWPGDEPLTR